MVHGSVATAQNTSAGVDLICNVENAVGGWARDGHPLATPEGGTTGLGTEPAPGIRGRLPFAMPVCVD